MQAAMVLLSLWSSLLGTCAARLPAAYQDVITQGVS
jgi:hypothetical protein